MLARHHLGQFSAIDGDPQTVAKRAQQLRAAHLVPDVPRQHVRRRRSLAQVVRQAGQAHRQGRLQARRQVEHHHQVHAGVDLGVVVGALRHAPQALHLGQQTLQRAALAQQLEHARRPLLHEPARKLLPDALGHQVIHLAVLHHVAHQLQGLWRDAEVGEARAQPRHAQDAHRVLAEGVGHMAQHPGLEVALPLVGVDQLVELEVEGAVGADAVRGDGDRVDREVAPCQVLLERHVGRGVHDKAVVAARGLALGPRQRVLFARARVQEHREVATHGQETLGHHLLGRGPHHDPVAILHRQAEQAVAHRAADHVNLHRASLAAQPTQPVTCASGRVRQRPRSRARPARRRSRPAHREARRRA